MLSALLAEVGLDPARVDEVRVDGADPHHATRFRIGEAAAAALGACGVAASDLWELRTGRRQRSRIEVPRAAASLLSFAFQRHESENLQRTFGPVTAMYPAANGRWVHLHGGFQHLREGALALLGCEEDAAQIAAAVAQWNAQALEDELNARGLCGARVRSADEWRAHPQGQAVAAAPLVEIVRFADAPAEALATGERPLAGVRALDLTRVLAGPTCARTLAEHGADVLRITSAHLPSVRPFAVDTGHGKLSARLDLRDAQQMTKLRELVRGADVFVDGYRSGSLARRGLGASELARLRPGIVVVSINCYGHTGPWSERGGWEQLAQSASGIALENGGEARPQLLPAAATDYTTGYLAALGAMVALGRRVREGGSYHVRVSLARTAVWLQALPRVEGAPAGFDAEQIDAYSVATRTPTGSLRHLAPALEMSETAPRWARPTAPLDAHSPEWPAR